MTTTTEHEFADDLLDLLGDHIAEEMNHGAPISDVRSYQEAGVMTYNAGLIVTLDDGSRYQITIVRSR